MDQERIVVVYLRRNLCFIRVARGTPWLNVSRYQQDDVVSITTFDAQIITQYRKWRTPWNRIELIFKHRKNAKQNDCLLDGNDCLQMCVFKEVSLDVRNKRLTAASYAMSRKDWTKLPSHDCCLDLFIKL